MIRLLVMAGRSASIEDIRESKLYTPSDTKLRLSSDSSYVALRQTTNLKTGNYNAKPKKHGQKRAKKMQNRSLTSASNRDHNKNTRCHGLCIHRIVQYLVLVLSISALAIVILMVVGVVVPYPGGLTVFLINFWQLSISFLLWLSLRGSIINSTQRCRNCLYLTYATSFLTGCNQKSALTTINTNF